MIRKLTVIYDGECGFCVRCARWLMAQRRHVRMECIPHGSPYLAELFPGLRPPPKAELTVIDDQGGVYYNANAWLMSLWALESYRPLANRMATPALRPFARDLFELVSANRSLVTSLLGLRSDAAVAKAIRAAYDPAEHSRCGEGACGHPGHGAVAG